MPGDYIEQLDKQRDLHVPSFAHPEDVTKDPNPEKPRNWPMSGERFILEETSKAKAAVEKALFSRPEFQEAYRKMVHGNLERIIKSPGAQRELTEPYYLEPNPQRADEGTIKFRLGDTLVMVEMGEGRYNSLTVVTGNYRDVEETEKRNGWEIDSLGGSSWKGPEDLFGFPIKEYIDLNLYTDPDMRRMNGLQYMSPTIYRKPQPGHLGEAEDAIFPQKDTVAARDAILDFAKRLTSGNLEIPDENSAASTDTGSSTPPPTAPTL